MKLYNKEQFYKLPGSTFYCKGKEWYFGDLCVKDETCEPSGKPIDWFYQPLNNIDANDTGEWINRLEDMKINGTSYPLQNAIQRDGLFEDNDLFLVYEEDDLFRLRNMINTALESL